MPTSLKDFVAFIQTTWGILAGITTFFPLGGSLIPFMPVPDGKRTRTSIMAFIGSAFILYLVFLTVRIKDLLPAIILGVFFFFCALMFFIGSVRAEREFDDEEASKSARRAAQSVSQHNEFMLNSLGSSRRFRNDFSSFRQEPRESPQIVEEETHRWLSYDERMILFYILTFIFLTGAFSVLTAGDYWRSR